MSKIGGGNEQQHTQNVVFYFSLSARQHLEVVVRTHQQQPSKPSKDQRAFTTRVLGKNQGLGDPRQRNPS